MIIVLLYYFVIIHNKQLFPCHHRSLQYLLQAAQPRMDQIDFVFRRLDPGLRLFLKGMDHPHIGAELHGVDHAERIAPERQRDLTYARTQPVHGLGDIGLSSFSGDRQASQADGPRSFRELLELLQRRLNPRNGPCRSGHALPAGCVFFR